MAAKSIPGFALFEDTWDGRAPLGWDVTDSTAVAESTAKYEVAEWLEEIADNPGVFEELHGRRYAETRAEPIDGRLLSTTYVPGDLFSVNGVTAENVERLFARNERLVCYFETAVGPMALILVGAMVVAGIETVWAGQVAPPPKTPVSTDARKGQQTGKET